MTTQNPAQTQKAAKAPRGAESPPKELPEESREGVREEGRKDTPDPIDLHLGARLRAYRTARGLSQESLGRASALTFQQIQKYESGANRISAGRLFQFARLLDVPVASFFADLTPSETNLGRGFSDTAQAPLEGFPEEGNSDALALLPPREMLDLVRAWANIVDATQRRKVLDLIKTLGDKAT